MSEYDIPVAPENFENAEWPDANSEFFRSQSSDGFVWTSQKTCVNAKTKLVETDTNTNPNEIRDYLLTPSAFKDGNIDTKLEIETYKPSAVGFGGSKLVGITGGGCEGVPVSLIRENQAEQRGLACIERDFFSFMSKAEDGKEEEFTLKFEIDGPEREAALSEYGATSRNPDVNKHLGDKRKIDEYLNSVRSTFMEFLKAETGNSTSLVGRVAFTSILHYPDSWMDHKYDCSAAFRAKKLSETRIVLYNSSPYDSVMFWPRSGKTDCIRNMATRNPTDPPCPRHVEVQHFVALIEKHTTNDAQKTYIGEFAYSKLQELTVAFCKKHSSEFRYLKHIVPEYGTEDLGESEFASELAFRNTFQRLRKMELMLMQSEHTHGFDYVMKNRNRTLFPQQHRDYENSFAIGTPKDNTKHVGPTLTRKTRVNRYKNPSTFSDFVKDQKKTAPHMGQDECLRQWLIENNVIIDHKSIIKSSVFWFSGEYKSTYLGDSVYSYAEVNKHLYLVNTPDAKRGNNTNYLRFKGTNNVDTGIFDVPDATATTGKTPNKDAYAMGRSQWQNLAGVVEHDKSKFTIPGLDIKTSDYVHSVPWGSPTCLAVMMGLFFEIEYDIVELNPVRLTDIGKKAPATKNSWSNGGAYTLFFGPNRYKMNPPFIGAAAERLAAMPNDASDRSDKKNQFILEIAQKHIIPFTVNLDEKKATLARGKEDLFEEFSEEELSGYDSTVFLQKLQRIETLADKYMDYMSPAFVPFPRDITDWSELAPGSCIFWPKKALSQHLMRKLKISDWEWSSRDRKTHIDFFRGMWIFHDRLLVEGSTLDEFMIDVYKLRRGQYLGEHPISCMFYKFRIPNLLVPLYLERVMYKTHKYSSFLAWHHICAHSTVALSDSHPQILSRVKNWNKFVKAMNKKLATNSETLMMTQKMSLLVNAYLYAGGLYAPAP